MTSSASGDLYYHIGPMSGQLTVSFIDGILKGGYAIMYDFINQPSLISGGGMYKVTINNDGSPLVSNDSYITTTLYYGLSTNGYNNFIIVQFQTTGIYTFLTPKKSESEQIAIIAAQTEMISSQNATIASQRKRIAQQDTRITQQNARISILMRAWQNSQSMPFNYHHHHHHQYTRQFRRRSNNNNQLWV